MTLKEQYAKGLAARGHKRVANQRSSKYEVWLVGQTYVFLGASGAVRISKSQAQATSRPVTDKVKATLIAWSQEKAVA
jgi:hypothetical protein